MDSVTPPDMVSAEEEEDEDRADRGKKGGGDGREEGQRNGHQTRGKWQSQFKTEVTKKKQPNMTRATREASSSSNSSQIQAQIFKGVRKTHVSCLCLRFVSQMFETETLPLA